MHNVVNEGLNQVRNGLLDRGSLMDQKLQSQNLQVFASFILILHLIPKLSLKGLPNKIFLFSTLDNMSASLERLGLRSMSVV